MKAKIISILSSIGAFIMGCFGSCGIFCLASGCCGGTAILGLIGLTGSSLKVVEKLTPIFLILTIVSLGYAFYIAYRPKPTNCCDDKKNGAKTTCCETETKESFFKSKSFLWITTIVCIILWTYPFLISSLDKQQAKSCCPQPNPVENVRIIKITNKPCCPQ